MIKLYLDIDGVLLTSKQTRPAEYSVEFIDFITNNFDCYWLTTHCKGDTSSAISYLSKYFELQVIEKLNKIKPTNWTTLKTEAIDFTSEFIWLDDYPLQAEINVLTRQSKNDRLIIVDLNKTHELYRVMAILKNKLS
jgi:hypothetical protein